VAAPVVGREDEQDWRAMSEHDSRRIIRQWNREIEDEIRRENARAGAGGPWKAVAWGALWVVWLAVLVALLVYIKALR
jgi:hypothetical protein